MKNYLVKATRDFDDTVEKNEYGGNLHRTAGTSIWHCTKERYEFLKQNNAVTLVGIEKIEETKTIKEEKTFVKPKNKNKK